MKPIFDSVNFPECQHMYIEINFDNFKLLHVTQHSVKAARSKNILTVYLLKPQGFDGLVDSSLKPNTRQNIAQILQNVFTIIFYISS